MQQSASQIEASRLADQCRLRSWADHEMMMVLSRDCFGVFCGGECEGAGGHSCCMDGNPHRDLVVDSPRSDNQSVRHAICACSLLFAISDENLGTHRIYVQYAARRQFRYSLFTEPRINHSKARFSLISPEIRTRSFRFSEFWDSSNEFISTKGSRASLFGCGFNPSNGGEL